MNTYKISYLKPQFLLVNTPYLMFSKNIQVTEPSKEKIHYDDSKKKTNAPWVYIGVIRPVKTAVTQRPTTDNLQN